MKLMIINGSLGGAKGNTARVIDAFRKTPGGVLMDISTFHLADSSAPTVADLSSHDAFLILSGTYWDSWGSPLQTFLESATPLEGNACWFGKPCGIVITMHSVGGKEVANRLQGVVNSLGLFVPPMSAMVFSLVNQLLQSSNQHPVSDFADDFWSLDDLATIAANLRTAAEIAKSANFTFWPLDRADPMRLWVETVS